MSAVQVLGAARAFGVHLEADGDDLLLEASGPPPDAVLDALSRHKPEVVRLLHSAKAGHSPEYWHVFIPSARSLCGICWRAAARRRRGSGLRMLRRRMAE
jgi:hypothetical protein